ncbi:MAG: hypothetical protein ACI9C9_002985 [Marivirga sp.]|jgi:hypothetical protein
MLKQYEHEISFMEVIVEENTKPILSMLTL